MGGAASCLTVGGWPRAIDGRSTVVAGGFVVVDGQGTTLDAWRMAVDRLFTESDRMESNKKVTVATITFLQSFSYSNRQSSQPGAGDRSPRGGIWVRTASLWARLCILWARAKS